MNTVLKTMAAAFFTLASVSYGQSDRGSAIIIDDNNSGLGGPVAGHVDHSSTIAEGIGRGVAAVVQADGQYNYLTSLGARNAEEARERAIENYKYGVNSLAEVRAAYKARITEEYRPLRTRLNSPYSVDAAPAAKIHWPAELGGSDLAGYRLLVERTMGQRMAGMTMTSYDRSRLNEATKLAVKKLERTSPFDAAVARQFLNSVLEPVNLDIAAR